MKTRSTALLVALLLAVAATAAVFLYVKGAKEQAKTGGGLVAVVVSKQDIPAGTQLDSLVSSGAFDTRSVPQDALVRGVVTSLAQLQGQSSAYPILANSQISTAFFNGSQGAPTGGRLGIPKGYLATTLSLSPQQEVGGLVSRGDHVTVYATLAGRTVILIPDALVLVGNPGAATAAGSSTQATGLVTLALTPAQAQRAVAAQGQAWFALLPPNQAGVSLPPITASKIK